MFPRPSVMVVDDEEELAILFRTFLARSGFDCVSFTDPLAALDHFSQNPNKYTVVITDWKMADLDGIQLAKKIREFNTTVKILLITAFFIDVSLRKDVYQEAHISDIMEKPIKLKDLGARIEDLYSKNQ